MENSNKNGLKPKSLKWSLILGIFQIIFAILFSLIVYILIDMYGGEFLIVAENMWILPTFAVILLGGQVYCLIAAIISSRKGKPFGLFLERVSNKKLRLVWLVFWSVWNIVSAILLFVVFRILYAGVGSALPEVVVVILSLPFFGYGGLLIVGSVKFYYEKLRLKKDTKLLHGLIAGGIAYLFIFGFFGGILAFWNPQWSDGVEHQPLFVTGEQPGRGYRIPALITLPGDIMLAFCESREDAMSDYGDIDLVMKRSINGGESWSAIQVLQDIGLHTVHNPCPLFDEDTQMVWLPFCIDYRTMHIISSFDFGQTWSTPRNLSQELGLEARCATGPGHGIQMSTGRLVIPSSVGGACAIFSDDNGLTWTQGEYVGMGGEPQVFESVDGALVFNLRASRGSSRIMAWSYDGGETWDDPYYEEELPAAGTQGSIHRFTDDVTYMQSRVLFSNPAQYSRGHLTLRMSYDEGINWPVSKMVYEGPSAYSQIEVLSDNTICLLFETGKYDYRESLIFAKLNINWLTNGQDSLVLRA